MFKLTREIKYDSSIDYLNKNLFLKTILRY